ncbi:NACHT domain-containing protein, partial [Candidatus Eisenbacteria bacterium]
MEGKASESKRIYKVFISSTYRDNEKRRRIVAEAVKRAKMNWDGMELFTADTSPPVEVCEKYAREADVLVGVIAWRYGWIPDEHDVSITEIEYEANQERLMFLVDRSVPTIPDQDFDEEPGRWDKQKKLADFKARIAKDQTATPFTDEDLGMKVMQALANWREQREAGEDREAPAGAVAGSLAGGSAASGVTRIPAASLGQEIQTYRTKAASYYASLPVAGFKTRLRVPIDIEEIYVPLHANLDLRATGDSVFPDSDTAEKHLRDCGATKEISLPEACRECRERGRRGIVILGDPGSGKTTHLKRMLLWCLRESPEEHGLPADTLPVFLPLRNLRDLSRGLDAFIEQELDSPHLQTPEGFGRRLLNRGKLLFLFDGLDEIPDVEHRVKVARWIGEALKTNKNCHFVVTCRFAGYSADVRLSEQFLEMHMRPLGKEQAEEFVRKWYRI